LNDSHAPASQKYLCHYQEESLIEHLLRHHATSQLMTDVNNDVYQQYDERLQKSKLMPLLEAISSDEGEVTSGDVSYRMTLEEANAFAKDRSNIVLTHADNVTKQMREFRNNTDTLGQMNESYNANKYIKDTLDGELFRVRFLHQEAKREVYKAQQRHMSTHHRAHHNHFLTRVFVYSLLATMLLAILLAAWIQNRIAFVTFIGLVVVALLVYAVLVAILFNSNTRRRQVHWKQYYWRAPPAVESDSCKK